MLQFFPVTFCISYCLHNYIIRHLYIENLSWELSHHSDLLNAQNSLRVEICTVSRNAIGREYMIPNTAEDKHTYTPVIIVSLNMANKIAQSYSPLQCVWVAAIHDLTHVPLQRAWSGGSLVLCLRIVIPQSTKSSFVKLGLGRYFKF